MAKQKKRVKPKIKITANGVQKTSFVDKHVQRAFYAFNTIVRCYVSSFLEKSRQAAYSASVSLSLWCVVKLLTVSKALENVLDSRENTNKTTEFTAEKITVERKSRTVVNNAADRSTESDVTLSKPVAKIIEETFNQEVFNLKESASLELKTGKFKKTQRKTKPSNETKADLNAQVDNVGYSFFTLKSGRSVQEIDTPKVENRSLIEEELVNSNNFDSVGHSFFNPRETSVEEEVRGKISVAEGISSGKVKDIKYKLESTQTSVINDHYNIKKHTHSQETNVHDEVVTALEQILGEKENLMLSLKHKKDSENQLFEIEPIAASSAINSAAGEDVPQENLDKINSQILQENLETEESVSVTNIVSNSAIKENSDKEKSRVTEENLDKEKSEISQEILSVAGAAINSAIEEDSNKDEPEASQENSEKGTYISEEESVSVTSTVSNFAIEENSDKEKSRVTEENLDKEKSEISQEILSVAGAAINSAIEEDSNKDEPEASQENSEKGTYISEEESVSVTSTVSNFAIEENSDKEKSRVTEENLDKEKSEILQEILSVAGAAINSAIEEDSNKDEPEASQENSEKGTHISEEESVSVTSTVSNSAIEENSDEEKSRVSEENLDKEKSEEILSVAVAAINSAIEEDSNKDEPEASQENSEKGTHISEEESVSVTSTVSNSAIEENSDEEKSRVSEENLDKEKSEEILSVAGAAINSAIEEDSNKDEPEASQENSEKGTYISEEQNIKPEYKAKMRTDTQVRVLTLNDNEHLDSTIYRIEKNWVLQFRLGPSLLGRKIALFCNYPVGAGGRLEFERKRYYRLRWCQDEGCEHADDTAWYAQIFAELSGSFHYFFTYEDAEICDPQGSGFFLVDPVLKYGRNEELPLDCIQCQTVLAKSLGPFSTWENKLRVAKESGYNMIHFTPIQKLGASNSSYSLSEQLKLNPLFDEAEQLTFEDIANFLSKIRREWKIASICDVVLNHTANESKWLQDHPEATYNCSTCPYMRPAYLLDAALCIFSAEVSKGYYENKGVPKEVSSEDHLNSIRYVFHSELFPSIKLHELYTCDVNQCVSDFLRLSRTTSPRVVDKNEVPKELKLIQDPKYRRLAATVDLDLALKTYNTFRSDCFDDETRLKKSAEDFKTKLDELNDRATKEVNRHLNSAIDNLISGMRYFRVQEDGPRIEEVSVENPLVFRYFTDYDNPKTIKEYEDIMYSEKSKYLMAHNGWVMDSDPLCNFAAPDSNVYLRRELIAWGDSVKLRYGDKPEDCPFLWQHMRAYVEQTAKIFDGIRLDNCHSTPIPVAEYLLDCARKVRPDLYVVAELFTNSDQKDNIFVNRLGITSLIREAMVAWDSHEEGRLIYRFGGSPVGAFFQPSIRPLVPCIAHALFLDLTHDNPSPIQKRSVFDLLPSSALVNMACCATGSNRGYDELVPHHIHVVDEKRQYTEWSDSESLVRTNLKYVSRKSGIISAKNAINDLHFQMGVNGYDQVYVDQMDADIVAVTRHNPTTHESIVLVAFTAFSHPDVNTAHYQRSIKPLRIEGELKEIILEASLSHVNIKQGGSKYSKIESFDKDPEYVNGLSEYEVHLKQHIDLSESDVFEAADSGSQNEIKLDFKNFKPGSVVAIRVSLPRVVDESVKKVRELVAGFSRNDNRELWRIISKMNLADLNRALYRCEQEERDDGNGFDVYDIPNYRPLVYCGLQGFMSLLSNVRPNNDLGHPMCSNLREGNWMIDYIWQRLKLDDGTKELGLWIEENTVPLKTMPRYLIPCYFDVIVTGIYVLLLEQSYDLMSDFVKHGSTFVRALSLGSVQFGATIKSPNLPQLSPSLAPPTPPTRRNDRGELVQACVTLAAGLPHFSVGFTRNWGRDTFIALRGLFILTGRYDEARYHILGYAACLRHGLIPNLLDGGKNARFNCRDAVWWWLYCIKCYAEDAPSGLNILSDKVSRLFPTDDSPPQNPGLHDQPLQDVMQEALQIHFQGKVFRERNAGHQIDEHMSDKGFNNQIGVHPETGFVFGGNDSNCGTWMDKMGSSEKAGNRGKPATPRDGSAVELIGLCKSVVSWLHKLNEAGQYPYAGVERTHKNGARTKWTFAQWADKIRANFEKCFWINVRPDKDEPRPDLINKRGIYKDCFGASQAPELFDAQHAWKALENAEKYLLGPLGMKTLDPQDWAYNGDYDNSNDSNEFKVAHGFNYHQGPEWVWPVGYYLRAKLHFAAHNGELSRTISDVKVVLSRHFTELQTSEWRGLPELTNANGVYCNDSSRTQAWSMSSILEVLYDLQRIESKELVSLN